MHVLPESTVPEPQVTWFEELVSATQSEPESAVPAPQRTDPTHTLPSTRVPVPQSKPWFVVVFLSSSLPPQPASATTARQAVIVRSPMCDSPLLRHVFGTRGPTVAHNVCADLIPRGS